MNETPFQLFRETAIVFRETAIASLEAERRAVDKLLNELYRSRAEGFALVWGLIGAMESSGCYISPRFAGDEPTSVGNLEFTVLRGC